MTFNAVTVYFAVFEQLIESICTCIANTIFTSVRGSIGEAYHCKFFKMFDIPADILLVFSKTNIAAFSSNELISYYGLVSKLETSQAFMDIKHIILYLHSQTA